MKADYDSQADALSIDLLDAPCWDDGEEIDDTYCNVALSGGRPANIELLDPRDHLDLLEQVAERFDLDLAALRAAAQATLAAPDRVISLDVAARAAA